jgi:hypothetical protein
VSRKSVGGKVLSDLRNIVKMTFVARRQNGNFAPAYARYVATAGNNVLSNTWRVDSEADAPHAAVRTLPGFVGRMGSKRLPRILAGCQTTHP